MNDNSEKDSGLQSPFSKWQALAFSAPTMGQMFFLGPMGVIQGIFAKHYGIALTTIAAVLLIGRLFDAVTDPLIGHYSDRYRARTGTRKPFVLVGGLCLILCSYFLFVPPDDVSVSYFIFWSLLYYLSLTMMWVPTNAWASEVSSDSVERTILFTILVFVRKIGMLLFYSIPFLPLFETNEITPETLRVSVVVGAVVLLLGLFCAMKYAPSGSPPALAEKDATRKAKSAAFKDMYDAIKRNRPFQLFTLTYMCLGLGSGMYAGLFFIFIDTFLGQGEMFATLSIVGLIVGLLFTPVFYKAVVFLGKKRTWFIATSIMLGSTLYTGQLVPGESLFIELVIVYMITVLGGLCSVVIAMPMLSETIDYGLLNDKTERRGTYFAVLSLMAKAEHALGLSLGLAIVGWLGFDATATVHDESSVFAMHMAISWVPAVFFSIGLFSIWLTPLDERRCAIICRWLQRRAKYEFTERQRLE